MCDEDVDRLFADSTPAREWHEMRMALSQRLKAVKEQHDECEEDACRVKLAREIKEIEVQIQTLRIEEAAQQFVEDAARVTLAAQRIEEYNQEKSCESDHDQCR
jgi:hypothetical protein